MKTMMEIVGSIKNDELRAFATKLQQKLEQARTAIVSRRKKVSGAEKSALRNSVSDFVEKQRGKLPQKVAGLLALTMLTACLASCDDLSYNPLEETVKETNAEEVYNNGISDKYGLPEFFSELRYVNFITDTSNSNYNYVMNNYKKAIKDLQDGKATMENTPIGFSNVLCIGSILSGEKGCVVIDVNADGWKHKIITTDNDFFMLSQNRKSRKSYLTGFYDKEFYNELGIISKESVIQTDKQLKRSGSYEKITTRVKGEFWGGILKETMSEDSDYYSGRIGLSCMSDWSEIPKVNTKLLEINLVSSDGKTATSLQVESSISLSRVKTMVNDASRGKLLEDIPNWWGNGNIFIGDGNNNPDYVAPEETEWAPITNAKDNETDYSEPTVVRPDDIWSDWWGEEATTAEEEVEPDVEPAEPEPEYTLGSDPNFGIEP